jgi:hypothetical protein
VPYTNSDGTPKTKTSIIATAVIAAVVGAAGGSVVTDNVSNSGTTTAPTEAISAQEEMNAFTGAVTGVEAVGMLEAGFAPHIHTKWNINPAAKAYNVYVDGIKKNAQPIVIIGDIGRYTDLKGLEAGKTYTVTVKAIGADNKESEASEAVQVTVGG